jgi:soluble lytic murein transglycosylase-like protein
MDLRITRTVVAVMAVLVAAPAAVSAQIYSWKDESGHVVLSNRPKDGSERTYAVAATTGFRATRAAGSRRGAEYEDLIADNSTHHGVNPELVRAVIQAESAFNPRARSVKGAMGLMQLMPATAEEYGVTDPYNPAQNIRAGVAYLKSLLVRYASNVELALAAYNAGPTAVAKYGGTVPPYRETRNYVAKIKNSSNVQDAPSPTRIVKTVEIVNGREITRYSNVPAATR